MNVYRIVVPDITYYVDFGCLGKMKEIETAACLVTAETRGQAQYRGLIHLGLWPGQYDSGFPPKVSCVCTRKNIEFPDMIVGMDVSDHIDWWEKENEAEQIQCEAVGQGNLCE